MYNFKFESITYQQLFGLLVDAIRSNNFYFHNRNYNKIRIYFQIEDLDFTTILHNVYIDENDEIKLRGNSEINVFVYKLNLEYGIRLLKASYHFREKSRCALGVTCANELTNYLIPILSNSKPLPIKPERTYLKDKMQEKDYMDIEIKKHARVKQINKIV